MENELESLYFVSGKCTLRKTWRRTGSFVKFAMQYAVYISDV
jgi:hypothetical protein